MSALRDSAEPREHHLMPSPTAVAAKGLPAHRRGCQMRAPLPESPADVVGVELEGVADGHEREGTIGVLIGEPGLDLLEETARPRALAPGFVPWTVILNAVISAGPVAGAMGFLVIGLLASTAFVVVLGAERTRLSPSRPTLIAVRRTPSDQRNAA